MPDAGLPFRLLRENRNGCAGNNGCKIDIVYSGNEFNSLKKDILHNGDTLIVSDIVCLGNSLFDIREALGFFADNNITLISARDGYRFEPKEKALLKGFDLALNIRKKLVSTIMVETLQQKKARGAILGVRKGQKLKKKLDGKQKEIQQMLKKGVHKSEIAATLGVGIATVYNFIRDNKLREKGCDNA